MHKWLSTWIWNWRNRRSCWPNERLGIYGDDVQCLMSEFAKCVRLMGRCSIEEKVSTNTSLRAEISMLKTSLEELKNLNTCLRDEHCALQLAFSSLEDKLRKVQVTWANVHANMYTTNSINFAPLWTIRDILILFVYRTRIGAWWIVWSNTRRRTPKNSTKRMKVSLSKWIVWDIWFQRVFSGHSISPGRGQQCLVWHSRKWTSEIKCF